MKKRIMSLLALLMAAVFVFAACGNSGNGSTQTPAETQAPAADAQAAPAETQAPAADAQAAPAETQAPAAETQAAPAEEQAPAETEAAPAQEQAPAAAEGDGYNVTWEDVEDIVIFYPSMGPIPMGLQAVEDAINEITEKEILVHVSLNPIEVGGYDQQISLMSSSGEKVDICMQLPAGATGLASMVSTRQLIEIDDLLAEYAPKTVAALGNYLSACQFNGATYAIPAYRGYASGIFVNMRTDVLEDLGLLEKATNMKTFTEYEEILQAVKDSEKWGNLAGVVNSDMNGSIIPNMQTTAFLNDWSQIYDMDPLGGSYCGASDDDTTVVNLFGNEFFYSNYELVSKWYQAGYVYEDATTSTDMGEELIGAGIGFSYFSMSERTSDTNWYTSFDARCGGDMTHVLVHPLPITTGTVTMFTWGIPTSAQAPEAAVCFLEMFFNDARLANLFAWGIEGVDYEVVDGVAKYIEGNEMPAYHTVSFLEPNCFNVLPWDGEAADARTVAKELNETAPLSPYLGFTCDTDSISTELAALSSAYTEYCPQVCSGMGTPDKVQEMLDKFESAGIQKVVDLYQEALNAWLANK